jgi:chemotaxis receptor (MCP) glutamine deamidase CheD
MRNERQEQDDTESDLSVDSGECRFTTDLNCRLIARHLQSCIALIVHAPKIELAAMLRFSLPVSAEIALTSFFERLRVSGAKSQDLDAYAVGGATAGKGSLLTMRRVLWREGVLLKGEETGGSAARSVWFQPATGRLIVRSESSVSRVSSRSMKGAKLWHFAS